MFAKWKNHPFTMQLVKVQTYGAFENRNESGRRTFLLTFKQYGYFFWDGMRTSQRQEWSCPGQKGTYEVLSVPKWDRFNRRKLHF